jgi:tetratricopeptide (TPR) repeat protein
MLKLLRVAMVLVLSWCAAGAPRLGGRAEAADGREIDAREAFVTGRYQRALELYGRLYAETLHPTYLRNIGRCYQKLGDAEHAVQTFRDYLRKVPQLPAKDRAEIDEYIAEMEALERKQSGGGKPGEARPAQPALVPRAPEPAPMLGASAPPVPAERASGSRVWLWTGLALAVVSAAVVAGVIWTRPSDADCPMGTMCYRP